jgi:hypothetical protein
MTDTRAAMKIHSRFLLALPLLGAVGAAHADGPIGQDLARCAAISAADARLACYDAMANRTATSSAASPRAPQPTPAASAPTVASPAVASAPAAPAVPARVPPSAQSASATAAAPTPPAAPATAAAVANPEDPSQFGLSPVQRHVAVAGPKEERGQIVSVSAGMVGHATVVLDSGQTWAVLDSDGSLSSGDKVVIKRAALGSFLMYTPSNHSYRVHRLQ